MMKLSFRVFGRIVFLLVVLVFLAVGVVLAWFTSWRSDKIAELESASEIAKTSYGNVEFLLRGDGPTVLVFHGAPGGYDQAMLLGSGLIDEGFQVLAPSRPGYLRTPLGSGLLPAQQADVMAALIDTLGLSGVAVLADSEGAPAAIEFALRHPNRLWALILLSPVTKKTDGLAKSGGSEFSRHVLDDLTGDIGSWFVVKAAEKDPRKVLDWLVDFTSNGNATQREIIINSVLQPANAGQLEWLRGLVGTFAPLSLRETGARNDLLQLRNLADLPFDKITAPTLVVQGAADACVPLSETQAAAGRIPDAALFAVSEAGHIVQLGPHAPEVHKKIVDFLNQNSGGQGQP